MSDLAFSDVFPPDHNRFVPVRSEHEIWQKLAYECAQGALYDSSERPPFSRCLPGTRVDLLNTLSQAAEEPDPKLIWLCGDSGSGKSAVAHSIAECMREKDVLAGTFFFSRTNLKCNNTHYLFPTIAYQLGLLHPRARDIVVKAIKEDPALLSIAKSRRDQFEKLVVAPLRQLRYSWKKGKVIVLDAFEEGTAVEEVKPLVDQFLSLLRDELIPVSHIILTSRPYAHIDAVMRDGDLSRDVRVVRLDEFDARDDISTFLSMSFKDVHTLHRLPYPDPWPSEEEMKVLQSLAGGRFIIAATIIRLMSQGTGERPTLHPNVFLGKILDEKLEIVDQLYHSILTSSEDAVRGSAYLSPLAALAEPIHLRALSALLCADMHLLLQPLASVIVVPPPESELKVHIFHDSFRDFLSQSQRCKTMFVEPAVAHAELACACLRLMIQKLRRDICALGDSSKLLSEIDDIETKGDDCIPQALRYACQYWAYHLQNARADAELVSLVFEFLTKHVLHSVEVLALLEQLDFAATSLFEARRALLKWQPFNKKDVAIALLYDAHRLVLEFFDPISISPLHIYESALPLCPTNTKLRRYYAHIASEASILAVEGIDEDWDCITRVIGADSYVTAVAVSPDGSLIASASENRVHMWDSTTGTLIASAGKQPHLGAPLVFSPCYPMLAYCCDDGTWTVWDFERDVCVELVEEDDRDSRGGRYQPSRCAIAPDGRSIACARKTHGEAQLAVWNIESGPPALVFRYRVHTESQVVATSFSNQGDRISFVNLDDVSILSSHTGELLSRWRLTRRQFFPGSWHCFTADDRFLLIVDDISVTVTSVDGSSQRTINTFTSANPPPRSRLGLAEMRDWFKRLQLRPSNNPLALVQPFLLNNAVVAVKAADVIYTPWRCFCLNKEQSQGRKHVSARRGAPQYSRIMIIDLSILVERPPESRNLRRLRYINSLQDANVAVFLEESPDGPVLCSVSSVKGTVTTVTQGLPQPFHSYTQLAVSSDARIFACLGAGKGKNSVIALFSFELGGRHLGNITCPVNEAFPAQLHNCRKLFSRQSTYFALTVAGCLCVWSIAKRTLVLHDSESFSTANQYSDALSFSDDETKVACLYRRGSSRALVVYTLADSSVTSSTLAPRALTTMAVATNVTFDDFRDNPDGTISHLSLANSGYVRFIRSTPKEIALFEWSPAVQPAPTRLALWSTDTGVGLVRASPQFSRLVRSTIGDQRALNIRTPKSKAQGDGEGGVRSTVVEEEIREGSGEGNRVLYDTYTWSDICVSRGWLVVGGRRVCWLPARYRPGAQYRELGFRALGNGVILLKEERQVILQFRDVHVQFYE